MNPLHHFFTITQYIFFVVIAGLISFLLIELVAWCIRNLTGWTNKRSELPLFISFIAGLPLLIAGFVWDVLALKVVGILMAAWLPGMIVLMPFILGYHLFYRLIGRQPPGF